jgi:hypothetical protein
LILGSRDHGELLLPRIKEESNSHRINDLKIYLHKVPNFSLVGKNHRLPLLRNRKLINHIEISIAMNTICQLQKHPGIPFSILKQCSILARRFGVSALDPSFLSWTIIGASNPKVETVLTPVRIFYTGLASYAAFVTKITRP